MLIKIIFTSTALALAFSAQAFAKDQIRAVGSSTVYPFVTVAAEEFGKSSKFKTPIIESTGTGGGFKLFCSGNGGETPDISNASRAIKSSETELCAKNGVKNIIELKIGYDGIVLAHSAKTPQYNLARKQVFLALARKVPSQGKLIDNPYQKWSDIDSTLPSAGIEIYGPPPTSGTRDAFVELVMEKECNNLNEFKTAFPKEKDLQKACKLIREDGKYIEAGENDNLIVQKLANNKEALGIFGYSFLEQNNEIIQGSIIEGVNPDYDSILSGKYSIARPLYVYVKGDHFGTAPGLKEFVKELSSEKALGSDGYLAAKGMIPLSKEEFKAVKELIKSKGV